MSAVGGGATLRGSAAVKEVAELLVELRKNDDDLAALSHINVDNKYIADIGGIKLDGAEVKGVVERRRTRVVTLLENKGIHIRPDAEPNRSAEPAAYEPGTVIDEHV